MWYVLLGTYLLLLVGVSLVSIFKYKKLDTPAKLIAVCVIITCTTECIAHYYALTHKSNLSIYHLYTPVQLFLTILYFNYAIPSFRKFRIGWIIGFSGLILAIINAYFFQRPQIQFNSNFLVFESIIIICTSLFFFYYYLMINEELTNRNHFWLTSVLFIFWSCSFVRWLLELTIPSFTNTHSMTISYLMWGLNLIMYSAFGLVFLFYNKLQPVDRK